MDMELQIRLKRIEAKLDAILKLISPPTKPEQAEAMWTEAEVGIVADGVGFDDLPIYQRCRPDMVDKVVRKFGTALVRSALKRMQDRVARGVTQAPGKTFGHVLLERTCDAMEVEAKSKAQLQNKERAVPMLLKEAEGDPFLLGDKRVSWDGSTYWIDGRKADWLKYNPDGYVTKLASLADWRVVPTSARGKIVLSRYKMFSS